MNDGARVCHVCGRQQRWGLGRVGQSTLALAVALASILTFLLPEVRQFLSPTEASVSVHFAHGDEQRQYFFMSNEGKKPALIRAAALVFQTSHGTLTAPVQVDGDPILSPNTPRIFDFQVYQVHFPMEWETWSGEEQEYYDNTFDWERKYPVYQDKEYGEEQCLVLRYLLYRATNELREWHPDDLARLEAPMDEWPNYASAYERVADLATRVQWQENTSWEDELPLGFQDMIGGIADTATLIPNVTQCLTKSGLSFEVAVLGSEGTETTLVTGAEYSQIHRFLLPALLGDNDYDRDFVSYFHAPTDRPDDWTSEGTLSITSDSRPDATDTLSQ